VACVLCACVAAAVLEPLTTHPRCQADGEQAVVGLLGIFYSKLMARPAPGALSLVAVCAGSRQGSCWLAPPVCVCSAFWSHRTGCLHDSNPSCIPRHHSTVCSMIQMPRTHTRAYLLVPRLSGRRGSTPADALHSFSRLLLQLPHSCLPDAPLPAAQAPGGAAPCWSLLLFRGELQRCCCASQLRAPPPRWFRLPQLLQQLLSTRSTPGHQLAA
jgi:hypothetical protein